MTDVAVKSRVESIDHHVGKRLRMRRIMVGLSQHDLGVAVNVSIQQIQKYEKAINRISSGKLHSFAKLLKVPISYFFEEAPEDNAESYSMAEESSSFEAEDKASEREVVSLVKHFNAIEGNDLRRKLIDIAKTLACQ